MPLEAGTRLGSYEVTAQLGVGGMGEVYRATDTKLGREVAIKTLPSALAQDPDRLARFEREAKLLAALNHAHIGAIYGLDEHEGTQFIAMELVEGQTLEEKLKDGSLPAEAALRIALQIVEALEVAHEKGVVHRDLKPANIMLTSDGVVKVLDFGLAKAFLGDPNQASPAHSPALSVAMTQQGLILGTAGYMSPEQASGQATDQRADIWAFGVVLYEMLTGLPLFSGESVPHVLAAVLQTEPDWNRLPRNLHPRLKLLLERCLEKKVRNRYHSIADVRVDIEKVLNSPSGVTQPAAAIEQPSQPLWRRALQSASVAAAAVVITAFTAWIAMRPGPQPLDRFYHQLPRGQSFRFPGWRVLTIAPDGRSIVYNASDGLYLRRLDELEASRILGTAELIAGVDFSPDGQSLWFGSVENTELKRISINGGAPILIADVDPGGGGGSWGPDGFYVSQPQGVYHYPVNGGSSELIIPTSAGERINEPILLPDGDALLFSVTNTTSWDDALVVAQSLSTGQRTVLVQGGASAKYLPTGHLIYTLGDVLFGIPFDPDSLSVSGAAVPLVQGLMRGNTSGTANYGVSNNGTLAYVTGTIPADARALVWVDREGRETPIDAPARAYTSPRISPDGTKVAVNARDEELDIWVWDLARETLTRLSFNPGQDRFPAWSPDGARIAYSAPSKTEGISWEIVLHAADGTGIPERLAGSGGQNFPEAFVPDGSAVLVRDDSSASDDIVLVPLDGTTDPKPLLNTPFTEAMPDLSSDGRWLAYVSNESGRNEVYVRPFPDVDSGRWQVSTGGGAEPLWSRDGRELFFRNGDALMVVNVAAETRFAASSAQTLFDDKYFGGVGQGGRSYDVSPDGERFLMIRPIEDVSEAPRIVIVQNWVEELKRLIPSE